MVKDQRNGTAMPVGLFAVTSQEALYFSLQSSGLSLLAADSCREGKYGSGQRTVGSISLPCYLASTGDYLSRNFTYLAGARLALG
jgi:hypothetical protein